jgi:hypothetical protein
MAGRLHCSQAGAPAVGIARTGESSPPYGEATTTRAAQPEMPAAAATSSERRSVGWEWEGSGAMRASCPARCRRTTRADT